MTKENDTEPDFEFEDELLDEPANQGSHDFEDIDECEAVSEIQYYLLDGNRLDGNRVGRVGYSHATEEYLDGQVMGQGGNWHECPAIDILAEGDEISVDEAVKRTRKLGGAI